MTHSPEQGLTEEESTVFSLLEDAGQLYDDYLVIAELARIPDSSEFDYLLAPPYPAPLTLSSRIVG